MVTLSLCMIAHNEESFLEDCLASVAGLVDEIIIGVDSRSNDRTREIAESADAKVFTFDWTDDFSAARNLTLKKATSNWILVLDADELIDPAGKAEIKRLINTKEHCLKDIIGFKLDQRTYRPKKDSEDAKAVKTTDPSEISRLYSGYESSKLVRLFKNHPKIRFRNKVHELVENSISENHGEIFESTVVLHHFSLLKGSQHVENKTKFYMDIIWKQLEQEPNNPRYNFQAGIAFLDVRRFDLALKYFYRTLKLNPKYPDILSTIAKLHVEMNNIRQAIRFFNAAIATNKKDVSSLNNLAVLYMGLGKLDTARKLLDKALIQEPLNKAVLSNYEKLKKKKDLKKAD